MAARIDHALAMAELARRYAQTDLLSFTIWTWEKPSRFCVGRHTRAIADRLTRAIEDFRHGISTYLLIAVPFRHGKSELCSINLPAFFLGRCADFHPDVILSGYGAKLVEQFSRATQRKIRSRQYQMLFPGVTPSGTVVDWGIAGSTSHVAAAGLVGGAITGKGGNLIVLDDYCKSREEAVSQVFRDKTWDAFRNNLFTRQNSPACIFVVTATPWHVDDLRGRIRNEERASPDFPRFEELNFPARKPGPGGWDYLFPEMYPPEWYNAQRAALQKQAAALLDCEPVSESGNRFDISKVVIHHTLDDWYDGREVRGWDLASSSKDRDKDNPDRTWGVRGSVKQKNLGNGIVMREMWIRSMVAIRAEAPARDALIRATALADGPGISQHVEAFAAYKDAYTQLKAALPNRVIKKSQLPGDKAAKLAPLEPVFQAGAVHIYEPGCKEWLDEWRAEFAEFPGGAHDDACDATAVMFHASLGQGSRALI